MMPKTKELSQSRKIKKKKGFQNIKNVVVYGQKPCENALFHNFRIFFGPKLIY